MMEDMYKRQSGLLTEEQRNDVNIKIVGVGGIGSHTALALARMGFTNMEIWDDDTVDTHNVASQGFNYRDIGKKKAAVVQKSIIDAVRKVVKVHIAKANVTTQFQSLIDVGSTTIIILAVDSMEARRTLISSIGKMRADKDKDKVFIINPSMGGEYMNVDVLDLQNEDAEDYLTSLFTDENAVQEACTSRATIYTTLHIGATICKMVKDIATEQSYVHNICYDIRNNSPIHIFNHKGEDLL